MIGGCLLLFASNFVSLWNRVTTAQCHLQPWFLAVGFTVYFGALTIKTWRVWRLYSNKTVDIIQITDFQLGSALIGITGITIVRSSSTYIKPCNSLTVFVFRSC